MKIAIVTDSTAVIKKHDLNKFDNLYTIPLQILMGEDVYKDGIDLSSSEFFELVRRYKTLPTTSQPSIGDVLVLFEELKTKYDQIIYLTISSKISGTYSTGMLAKNQLDDDNVYVFDSLNTSVVLEMLSLKACELVLEGYNAIEIVKYLEKMRDNSAIYLVVDDLKHLGRTGRVNNVSAVVGALLKIKPILRFEDGVINLHKKIRTIAKAHSEVFELLSKEEIGSASCISIAHADGYEYAVKMRERILSIYPDKDIIINELSPVISVHTGPKSLGVGWIK